MRVEVAGEGDARPGSPTALEGTPRPRRSERPANRRALLGTILGERYRIERLLGEGGMGAVFQAEHTLMRKRMAIKVLHPEMTRLPEVVARFEREAMAAAHIDHPHVVTATDFGKLEDGSFYLALEFVEGRSLREVIAQGRLDLGRALHVARQMASALSRAHALKIVHRDLKPENVMLVERDGDPDFVKVLDFGIAKVQIGELTEPDPAGGPGQAVLTQAGMIYGTPEYMAPEQALGQPVDARADLYALGVIMYEMITGSRPFEVESKVALLGMHVTAPVPPMHTKAPDLNVPPEVEALVVCLLAKEASDRLGDAKLLIDSIDALVAQLVASGKVDARYVSPPASRSLLTSAAMLGDSSSPDLAARLRESIPSKPTAPSKPTVAGGKSWLIAAFAGTLGIVVLVTTIFIVLRRHATGANETEDGGGTIASIFSDKPASGLDARVASAIAMIDRGDYGSGIKALDDLGDAAKGREDVHRALFTAYSATDRWREAMVEAGMVLAANPNLDLRDELKLRVGVRDTALLEGTKDDAQKAAVEEAFSLLDAKMGTIGWDDVYDIAYGTSGQQYPKAAARAKKMLAKGDRAKMSPALAVTMDVRAAGATCKVKNVLERAQKDGDERTVALLKPLVAPRYVGHWRKTDTLACIHGDASVGKTVAAIEERLRAQKK